MFLWIGTKLIGRMSRHSITKNPALQWRQINFAEKAQAILVSFRINFSEPYNLFFKPRLSRTAGFDYLTRKFGISVANTSPRAEEIFAINLRANRRRETRRNGSIWCCTHRLELQVFWPHGTKIQVAGLGLLSCPGGTDIFFSRSSTFSSFRNTKIKNKKPWSLMAK